MGSRLNLSNAEIGGNDAPKPLRLLRIAFHLHRVYCAITLFIRDEAPWAHRNLDDLQHVCFHAPELGYIFSTAGENRCPQAAFTPTLH